MLDGVRKLLGRVDQRYEFVPRDVLEVLHEVEVDFQGGADCQELLLGMQSALFALGAVDDPGNLLELAFQFGDQAQLLVRLEKHFLVEYVFRARPE